MLLATFIVILGISEGSGRQLHEARQEIQQEGQLQCKQEASWNFSVCTTDTSEQLVTYGGGNARVAPLLGISLGSGTVALSNAAIPAARSATSGIGFRTGGAQDIENFRENINNGYLPLPTDVSFGGVVKDYYFDTTASSSTGTTATTSCSELFCPVYSAASTVDPLLVTAYEGLSGSGFSNQLYLAVGLDSGLKAADVQRKPLNIVLLLDYSGSMSSPFDAYYYDTFGNRQNLTAEGKFSSIYCSC